MKPSQLWRFHSSSEKYSCSNPLINVCLADVSMETVFTAPQCSKNGSKVIRVPGEGKVAQIWWTAAQTDGGLDLACLIQHACCVCPRSAAKPHLFSPVCLFKAARMGWFRNNTPPRLPPCVYFSSFPSQKFSEQKQKHFHMFERAAWKPWQLLRGWCCVSSLQPPTHYTPLHFELKDATEKEITHSLPQSSVFHCTFLAATLRQHII